MTEPAWKIQYYPAWTVRGHVINCTQVKQMSMYWLDWWMDNGLFIISKCAISGDKRADTWDEALPKNWMIA